jgi:Mrp family chromosome partitioning ATPase
MSEIVERQRDRFDFVLIDCPPVIGLADTLAIAPLVDAMIMVASAEVSKRGALMHSVDQLGQVGATVRAGVLNNVVVSRRKGTYGYGYGYGYGATEPEDERERPSRSARADRTPGPSNGNGRPAVPSHVPEDLTEADAPAERAPQPTYPEQATARSDQ